MLTLLTGFIGWLRTAPLLCVIGFMVGVFILALVSATLLLAWRSKREIKPKPKIPRPTFGFLTNAAITHPRGYINEQDIPLEVSTNAVITPQTLAIEAVPRQDVDMKTGCYHCDLRIHNLSKAEDVANLLVFLKDIKPVPSQAYRPLLKDKQLPLPNVFPIQLKPRYEGGSFVWADNKTSFSFLTLIRASNIPTVEVIGAKEQFCPFQVDTWWKDNIAHFAEYIFTIEVSAPPDQRPRSQRFQFSWVDDREAKWVSNPKGIMAFTVLKIGDNSIGSTNCG